MSDYYVFKPGGQPEGPIPHSEIARRLTIGDLKYTDQACIVGSEHWECISKFFSPPPPPPPPLPSGTPPRIPQAAPLIAETRIDASLTQISPEIPNRSAVASLTSKVGGLMTPGEYIISAAAQTLNLISPDGVVLTNRRIFIIRPQLGGLRMSFTDFLWPDVINVHIDEGVIGTTFKIQGFAKHAEVERLDKEEARGAYRMAQRFNEEMMRHSRHQKELDTLRAGAAVFRR